MQRSLFGLLHSHRAALKKEWSRRLYLEPQNVRVTQKDLLADLMDQTLDELENLMQKRPSTGWFALHRTHLAPLHSGHGCGLNPLLTYFSTGDEALKKILSVSHRLSESEKVRVGRAWHFIAQSEIQALCGDCRNICAPALSFPVAFGRNLGREGFQDGLMAAYLRTN
jgi:hypothetical protein